MYVSTSACAMLRIYWQNVELKSLTRRSVDGLIMLVFSGYHIFQFSRQLCQSATLGAHPKRLPTWKSYGSPACSSGAYVSRLVPRQHQPPTQCSGPYFLESWVETGNSHLKRQLCATAFKLAVDNTIARYSFFPNLLENMKCKKGLLFMS